MRLKTVGGDDYYVRIHRARDYFLPYRIRGNAWRVGSQLIDWCIQLHQKGMWISKEEDLAVATHLSLPALRRAVRKLEAQGVLRRDNWVELWWYEIRPHYEWRNLMTRERWWSWARATISVRKWNPAALGAYQHEWTEVAGEEASKHSQPVRRDRRTLTVACANETWRKWLENPARRDVILRRLRVRFGEISTILFVVRTDTAGT